MPLDKNDILIPVVSCGRNDASPISDGTFLGFPYLLFHTLEPGSVLCCCLPGYPELEGFR